MGRERTTAPKATTMTRRYLIPDTRMEWSSERRDLLKIHVPRVQCPGPRTDPDGDFGLTLPEMPGLPSPQREGLKLNDRSWGYEYALKTHIVPAAWPRSTPDVGYPTGCSVDGLQGREGSERVREEMLKTKKGYLKGELSEGKDERQYWVCVNRYVRTRLEEEGEGRKRLTLLLTHGVGFGKEVSTAEYLISSTFLDFFAVLGTGVVASTVEPRRGRSNYRRSVVLGRCKSRGFCIVEQGKTQLAL